MKIKFSLSKEFLFSFDKVQQLSKQKSFHILYLLDIYSEEKK